MQLVATLNGKFFRAISVTEDEIEVAKEYMLKDQEGLEFQVMSDEEFEEWLVA
ncbi:MAG TPA: hypothetical protein VIK89_05960 [Cytophagaceae bacterium]